MVPGVTDPFHHVQLNFLEESETSSMSYDEPRIASPDMAANNQKNPWLLLYLRLALPLALIILLLQNEQTKSQDPADNSKNRVSLPI